MSPIFISSWHARVHSQVSWHKVREISSGLPESPSSTSEFRLGRQSAGSHPLGAAGAEASGPRGPSPGSPRLPGLSSSRRRHRRCSSRLCQCRRSLDRLLFPWLSPAWQLVGCQAWGGGRGRGETGREEGRGGERRGKEGRVGKGDWRSALRGTRRLRGDPGCPGERQRERRAAGSGAAAGRLSTAPATQSAGLG